MHSGFDATKWTKPTDLILRNGMRRLSNNENIKHKCNFCDLLQSRFRNAYLNVRGRWRIALEKFVYSLASGYRSATNSRCWFAWVNCVSAKRVSFWLILRSSLNHNSEAHGPSSLECIRWTTVFLKVFLDCWKSFRGSFIHFIHLVTP